MMQTKDWISLVVGALVFLLGFLSLFKKLNILPVTLFAYIASIAGFYLLAEAVIEITNSNIIGWWSFGIAFVILLIGLPPALHGFGIGPAWFDFKWLSQTIYHIIFMAEGIFLMIACFAMEL